MLIPDLDAGCSLADSITAEQLRAWKAKHPGAIIVMYVNTTAEIKAQTDYCVTSSNAVAVVEHILREHGADTEILFGPDMFLGAYVEKRIGRTMHVWDGECHVHAGIRPGDITAVRAAHPGADFLIHPECGCSTTVMEYVAAGDVDAEGVHMLSTGGMLDLRAASARPGRARRSSRPRPACSTRCARPRPTSTFIAANERASCKYMKMITLPKLRDALRERRTRSRSPARSPSARASRSSGWSRSTRSAVTSGAPTRVSRGSAARRVRVSLRAFGAERPYRCRSARCEAAAMEPTIRFEPPDWGPLEQALPQAWLDGWMFMAYLPHPEGGEELRAYKHQITRRYLHLRVQDGALEAHRYTGRSTYAPAELQDEIEDAYATIEQLGYTREMTPIARVPMT